MTEFSNVPIVNTATKKQSWEVYRRLLTYTERYWGFFVVGMIGFAFYAAMEVASAKYFEFILEAVESSDQAYRNLLPVGIIVIIVVRGISSFIGTYGISYVGRRTVHDLRCELFEHLLALPQSYYHKNVSGHLVSKMTYDVEQVAGATTEALKIFLKEGLTAIGLLTLLFYENWKLTLIFLTVGPLIGAVIGTVSRRFRKISKRLQLSMGDVTQQASEVVRANQVVKSFTQESFENEKFVKASDYNLKQHMKMIVARALSTPAVQIIAAIPIGFIVWLSLQRDIMGEVSAGEFVVYIAALGMLVKPIKQLTNVNAVIQRGIAAAVSIFSLLDENKEIDNGGESVSSVQGRLAFTDVNFRYLENNELVLKNVSFDVQPGQVVALVGRSGSGKSSLVSLLPRFYDVSSGSITLDGVNIEDYKLNNLRTHIATVSQNVFLFNDTIMANIAYGEANPDRNKVKFAAEKAHAMTFIDDLPNGLDSMVGQDGSQLSGGQRQRIAIARAFYKDAPVLILDEATSALDTESEYQVQQALNNVMRDRTTIVIAHRLSTIENADVIMVMDKGEIIERGSHAGLIESQGAYYQLQHNKQLSDADASADGSDELPESE